MAAPRPLDIRPHAWSAAALMAAAAILGALRALALVPPDPWLIATLGAATLLLQAALYGHLPNLSRRQTTPEGLAELAGPLLFPAAVLGSLLDQAAIRDTALSIALALTGAIPLLTLAFGKPWRASGRATWRKPGPYQSGDIIGLGFILNASLAFLLIGTAHAIDPAAAARALPLVHPLAILLAASGLALSLLPRLARQPARLPLAAAAWASTTAAVALALARVVWPTTVSTEVPVLLSVGLALLVPALWAPGRRGGPRWQDARALAALAAASGLTTAAAALWSAFDPTARVTTAGYASLVLTALSTAGLAFLLLAPILLNALPSGRAVATAALVGATGLAMSWALPLRLTRWAAIAWALALLLALAAIAPMRTPRRDCPPNEETA